MIPSKLLAPILLTFALASCASQQADQYDTPAAAYGQPSTTEDANPVYDTPAAYEETGTAATPANPPVAYQPAAAAPVTAPPRAPSNGAAIIHTVVAGDTLSGLSSKYKVPSANIRQANNMTSDVVVLGKKMVIPPVN